MGGDRAWCGGSWFWRLRVEGRLEWCWLEAFTVQQLTVLYIHDLYHESTPGGACIVMLWRVVFSTAKRVMGAS